VHFENKNKQMMNHKIIVRLLILFLTIGFSTSGWCSQIIYPWNATTAIVKAGENFTIWFEADTKTKINSVILRGPYNTVLISSVKTKKGAWVYDEASGATYNRKITVTIPEGTPMERYDLIVNTSLGESISHKSVKVIRAYKTEYSIFHISDTHLADESVRAKDGIPRRLPYLSALVDISNLIGAEMVFLTGDNVNSRSWDDGNADYLKTWPSTQERINYYYKGSHDHNLKGVYDFSAPAFSVNGNHDHYERENDSTETKNKPAFWNKFHGLRTPHFTYGEGRFMALSDDFEEDLNIQGARHAKWLNEVGKGNLRIIYKHKYKPIPQPWATEYDIQLGLAGHNHHIGKKSPYRQGNTDMYIANFTEYTTFNLINVKPNGKFNVENNLVAIENPKDDPSQFRSKLTLNFSESNDGTALNNTATLINKFGVGFPEGKIRFIMPKGGYYTINKGSIEQQFQGNDVTVVDVRVPLKSNSTTVINISTTNIPLPTLKDFPYGDHERQTIDFWKADSDTPTPLAFIIHGGGWKGGGKERINRFVDVEKLLSAGISVAAINYRYVQQAPDSEIDPPVKTPLYDAARALQFVRSKAKEWNIDKTRIGASGGSAGACSSLWLAFQDDLADPKSKDPIARESTRLHCAAVIGAQTTLDPKQMVEWTPNSNYGAHAFGKHNFDDFLNDREEILPWINEYSPYALVSKKDPPVCLIYTNTPQIGQEQKDPTHTANFGLKLDEKCKDVGVESEFIYGPNINPSKTATEYLIKKLKE
jgi:acetyl esterase/lipase